MNIMMLLIVGFGMAMAVAGVSIVINPELIFGYLRRNSDSPGVHLLAILVRLVLGVLLVVYAGASRYPLIMEILGWLSLTAAIVLGLIGRRRFIGLMSWALGFTGAMGRVAGLFAVAFGGFLVYAYVY